MKRGTDRKQPHIAVKGAFPWSWKNWGIAVVKICSEICCKFTVYLVVCSLFPGQDHNSLSTRPFISERVTRIEYPSYFETSLYRQFIALLVTNELLNQPRTKVKYINAQKTNHNKSCPIGKTTKHIIIMCNVRLRSLHELYCNLFIRRTDTYKCIFCLGAPGCLNVFWFFQANKWWWWWW